jgi:uncharacterized Zn finger protein
MDFVCPKCASRSFMVLHDEPMQVECLKCGTVAPFSTAVGPLMTSATLIASFEM